MDRDGRRIRIVTRGRLLWVLLVITALVCLGLAWTCWDAAHVTYYLPIRPGAEGRPAIVAARHDTLGRPLAGAAVEAVLVVAAVTAGLVLGVRRPVRFAVLVGVTAVVGVFCAVLATSGPPQTY